MTRLVAVLALLGVGCAPAVRLAGRCPTLPAFAADFALTGVGLAGSVLAYNEGDPWASLGLATAAMTVALLANVSECGR